MMAGLHSPDTGKGHAEPHRLPTLGTSDVLQLDVDRRLVKLLTTAHFV